MVKWLPVLGVLLAAAAAALLVRAGHPEMGAGPGEASWAPRGIRAIGTPVGLLAVLFAVAALVAFAAALRARGRAAPATFFDEDERRRIREAIAAAEARTSGEIRVHLARSSGGTPMDTARRAFEAIGMTTTSARNGVLIWLSVDDHAFAILGDRGIDEVVPDGFWNDVRARMSAAFAEGRFADGVVLAVEAAGEKLAAFFPRQPGDRDELPDDLSVQDG
ncbi:MAG: TPM domain-containing protein [Candidatus Eiseniibacteriota bacterium]